MTDRPSIAKTGEGNTPSASQTRVLVIEDDPVVRSALCDYLEDSGYAVLSAAEGHQGMTLFHREHPDLVLCDLRLPRLSGHQILELIHHADPEVPVIVVSGVTLLNDVIDALKHHAWDYVLKPLHDMAMLDGAIQRSLQRAQLIKANREIRERLETMNWRLRTTVTRLRHDEEAGHKIQKRLLPPDRERFGAFLFRRSIHPAMYLCGDFIDYFVIDEQHTGFYMTDVSGHDAASAFVTVMLKTLIGTYRDAFLHRGIETILRPDEVLAHLNEDLIRQELGKYCTLFYGVLDHDKNSLYCSSAGQFPYPVMTEGYETRPLEFHSRPIGLFKEATYETWTLPLPGRFRLILVSDGALELIPKDRSRTRSQRLLDMIDPDQDIDGLVRRLHLDGPEELPDDVSILTLSRGYDDG